MTIEFRLPELGENIEEADVISVLVAEGDAVAEDAPLIEVETDKATLEVPSPSAGTVGKIHISAGQTIAVGTLIVTIEEGDAPAKAPTPDTTATDTAAAEAPAAEAPATATPEAQPAEPTPTPTQAAKAPSNDAQPVTDKPTAPAAPAPAPAPSSNGSSAAGGGGIPAAPSVRQFAREIGVDVGQVPGSGPAGRVSQDDVKRFARERGTGGGAAATPPALPDLSKYGPIEREPMTRIRRTTAQNLSQTWAFAPHVTHHDKVDITDLEDWRQRHKKEVEAAGGRLTMLPILLKIIAAGLKAHPKLNASIDMTTQETVFKRYYNIGVAVDTPRGLVVPVVRDVDQKSIVEISQEIVAFAGKARDNKLSLDDMQGGSFTVSNLGGMGTGYFSPIINGQEVAILGVGRTETQPVWQDGAWEPRQMMLISLTYDHRLVDGADAARFVSWLVDAIQEPLRIAL